VALFSVIKIWPSGPLLVYQKHSPFDQIHSLGVFVAPLERKGQRISELVERFI
jgi:hypothetical protein